MNEHRICDKHHRSYPVGADGYVACPKCDPTQPRSLCERREDETESMGTAWFWNAMSRRWERVLDYHFIEADTWGAICALMREAMRPEDRMLGMAGAMRAVLSRATGRDIPITDYSRPRYQDLADRCQRLDEDLRRVRADRDRLRDENAELRGRR